MCWYSSLLILSLHPSVVGERLDRAVASAGMLLGADAYVSMPVFHPGDLVGHIRKLQPRVPMLQQASGEEKRKAQ